MLEILIIIALSRKIAEITKNKGRGAAGWIVMFIALWIGGELLGAFIAVFASVIVNGGEEPNMLFAWVGGLVGAATGAVISFAVINSLAPLGRDDEYWQAPESEGYRERFDAKKYQGQIDRDKYRPKGEADVDRSAADEQGYRSKPDEV
jgi:hypothetical protein